jgi:cold shock CspA family protein
LYGGTNPDTETPPSPHLRKSQLCISTRDRLSHEHSDIHSGPGTDHCIWIRIIARSRECISELPNTLAGLALIVPFTYLRVDNSTSRGKIAGLRTTIGFPSDTDTEQIISHLRHPHEYRPKPIGQKHHQSGYHQKAHHPKASTQNTHKFNEPPGPPPGLFDMRTYKSALNDGQVIGQGSPDVASTIGKAILNLVASIQTETKRNTNSLEEERHVGEGDALKTEQEQEIKLIKDDIQALRAALEDQANTNAKYEQQIDSCKQEIDELNKERQGHELEIEELKKERQEREEFDKKTRRTPEPQLEAEIKQSKANHAEEVAALERKHKQHEQKVEALETETKQKYEQQIRSQQATIENLEANIEAARSQALENEPHPGLERSETPADQETSTSSSQHTCTGGSGGAASSNEVSANIGQCTGTAVLVGPNQTPAVQVNSFESQEQIETTIDDTSATRQIGRNRTRPAWADLSEEDEDDSGSLDKTVANIGKCTGTVIAVWPDKDYGFVRTPDGRPHFFHKEQFVDRAHSTFPEQDDCLTFDLEASPIKPGQNQCCNISKVRKDTEVAGKGEGKGKAKVGKNIGKGKDRLNHEPVEPCGTTADVTDEQENELNASEGKGTDKGKGKGTNTGSSSDGFRIKLIPDEYVGHVIGKQGASLQKIKTRSGANIDARTNEGNEPGQTAFKLTGTTEAVEKASQMIDQIVQETQDYEQGKGKGKDRKDTDVAGKAKGKGKDRPNHEPGEPCGTTAVNGSTSDVVQNPDQTSAGEYAGQRSKGVNKGKGKAKKYATARTWTVKAGQ